MGKMISLMLVVAGAISLGDTHLFDCAVKERGQAVSVKFGIGPNLKPDTASLVDIEDLEDVGPIVISPEEINDAYSVMTSLNAQGGDLRMGKTQLTLYGDDDGVQYVWLVLYKKSNFTKGYVRFKGQFKKEDWFQRITCTHDTLENKS